MPTAIRLLLLYRTENVADTRKLDGIVRFLRTRPEVVSRIVEPELLEAALADLRRWQPDAILATAGIAVDLLARLGDVPVVRTDSAQFGAGTAHVYCHGRAAGREAARFLARRRPATLACVHAGDQLIAERRRAGFREEALATSLPIHEFDADGDGDLAGWLRSLPKPCGLLAWNDGQAAAVLATCAEAELRVPADVAVVGVDNTAPVCETARPTLTSVAQPFARIGEEATRLALDLVEDRRPPILDRELPPEGIVERGSTAVPETDDPLVAKALAAISAGRLDRACVEELCIGLGCSRRTLERRFRRELGRSVHGVLTDRRVRIATRLLAEGRPVAETARACGYRRAQSVEDLLRRETGRPPRAFR